MDSLMFSPYGYGPLPPSAMAEIEKKTAALRTSSFHRMLDLEKKHKIERLQSAPVSPPSSPPPVETQEVSSLQVRRAESLSQQQNQLMLKAVRRSVVIPSLSIAIPQSPNVKRSDQSRESDSRAEQGAGGNGEPEAKATAEPLQKQVKFEDDGEMSDQSSICQSPSWEGYGQRKKEKKKEAERRKKEKEQAEKEAKAAKKRLAARLSKSPPPAGSGRGSRTGGLTNADRSRSDPLLIGRHLAPEPQPQARPKDVGRTVSADDLQRFRNYQPAVAEIMSDSNSNARRFVGGVKLDRERDAMLHHELTSQSQDSPTFPHHLMCDNGVELQPAPHSPPLDGTILGGYPSSQSSAPKQESRGQRDAFPPSASRTPMLRQMPPPPSSRSNSLLQGATKIFRGRDGKSQPDADSDRGRHREGYVQQQRAQSVERSFAELAYEQLVNNGSLHSSSTRSSSRHTQHTRRSSFTQEARSVAMKLAGMKTTPAAKENSAGNHGTSGKGDYFNYTEHTYPDSGPIIATPSEGAPARSQDDDWHHLAQEQLAMSEAALSRGARTYERPATAQSSVSSGSPSVAGSVPSNQSKKGRSLRDAAKAALNISSRASPKTNASRSPMPAPLYPSPQAFTDAQYLAPVDRHETAASMASPPEIPQTTISANPAGYRSGPTQSSSTQQPTTTAIKGTEVDAHVGSRVSEGSSSSSAYEDGSPLPSPVTTPNTSRPQSSKDVPFTVGEIMKDLHDPLSLQDDDTTLRQSSDGSGESSTSSTPRLVKSESHESEKMTEEDRWSRTALPLDIDCDAQSFTTSFSNLDNIDTIDETLAKGRQTEAQRIQQPRHSKSLSDSNLHSGISTILRPGILNPIEPDDDAEAPISIPPRSKKRDLLARSPTSPKVTASPEQPERNGVTVETASAGHGEVLARGPESSERGEEAEKRSAKRDKGKRKQQQREALLQELERTTGTETWGSENTHLDRSTTPDAGMALFSGNYAVQDTGFGSSSNSTSHPYFEDHPGAMKTQPTSSRTSSQASTSPTSPQSPRFAGTTSPPLRGLQRAPEPPRMASASVHPSRTSSATSVRSSATSPPTSAPSPAPSVTRPTGSAPVSILKQPARSTSDPAPAPTIASRAPVLSALPKHMQLQAGMSVRPPFAVAEARMVPIAKMFVECCNCKFYHDMPSKLYECMAKPDAVVEDKLLGISGAITTMVKCPWCQHNMSTNCCAGYAAVVYLKEKLH